MRKRREWEHEEQCALIERVRLQLEPKFPECKWLYAVPNEGGKGTAGMIRSAMMKREGQRKGVSDLCLPSPRYRQGSDTMFIYMGLYMEMKPAPVVSPVRGSISVKPMKPDQKKFQEFVLSQGYAAMCCHGQDYAWNVLSWYLNLDIIDSPELKVEMPKFSIHGIPCD